MTDYTDQTSWTGLELQVVRTLRDEDKEILLCQTPDGVEITIFPDSTRRELMWQYEAKSTIVVLQKLLEEKEKRLGRATYPEEVHACSVRVGQIIELIELFTRRIDDRKTK